MKFHISGSALGLEYLNIYECMYIESWTMPRGFTLVKYGF